MKEEAKERERERERGEILVKERTQDLYIKDLPWVGLEIPFSS